jgi:Xaa-Pro aminopeptidase
MASMLRPRHKNKNVLMYTDSESDADMLYGTDFQAGDPFIFVRTARGRRHLVMSDLEIDRARAQSNAHHVHSLVSYSQKAHRQFGARAGVAEIIVTLLRDLGIRSVVVPGKFPLDIADRLRALKVRVTAHGRPLFEERLYKTPREITAISRACRATERGMKAGIETLAASRIRNGYLYYRGRRLTAETLRGVMNTTVLELGYMPANTIVAPGKQGCDPHDRGSGAIRANLPVILDLFPRSEKTGYYADLTRTIVRGKASDMIKKMYVAVRDGQRLGLRLLRHGVDARHVHAAIHELFESRGFETGNQNGRMQGFFHGTGHGLGLEIHERPRIGEAKATLEAGMVLTVEPGLYYYPHGGVRIEDTVVVTRTGVKMLTKLPKVLEI